MVDTILKVMKEQYPDVNFDNVNFIFSKDYNRSRYFRNEEEGDKYVTPTVCISTRAMLRLYDKRSLKMKKTVLYVGHKIQMECSLIHELTHHAQYQYQVRIGNELDTTRNELEYLEKYYPEDYKEIMGN